MIDPFQPELINVLEMRDSMLSAIMKRLQATQVSSNCMASGDCAIIKRDIVELSLNSCIYCYFPGVTLTVM